jgi:hypothetical protein
MIEIYEKNNGCMTCSQNTDRVLCASKHLRWRRYDSGARLVIQEIHGCADWSPAREIDKKAA